MKKGKPQILSLIRKYTVAGILTVIPISVTFLILRFLVNVLAQVGTPAIAAAAELARPYWPGLADWLLLPWFQSVLAVVLILLALAGLGWFSTLVVGRRLMDAYDRLMGRIPLVKQIYGAAKQLLDSLQTKPDGVHRVVMVEFPVRGMRMVGFVTQTFDDAVTGRRLAAVFIPTTPNPTTGYLEVVPVEALISTDWTADEAMNFIVSGGAVYPANIYFDKSANGEPAIGPEPPGGPPPAP